MPQFAAVECRIRQLHAHYTDAVWRKDRQAFADCFAQDAQWHIAGQALCGREEIADGFLRFTGRAGRVLMTFRTPLVDMTGPATANARTYVTEQCTWMDGPPSASIGCYHERFVKGEDGRWRFSWRLFQLFYKGPADLTGPFHEAPDFGAFPAMPPLDGKAPGSVGCDPPDSFREIGT